MTKKKKPLQKPKPKAKRAKGRKKSKEKKYFHRECHLCSANIENGPDHVCVPLTEKDIFKNLPEDFQDAFQLLKRKATTFGEQKIYNNARAVMFSTRVCYMFVRLKKTYLELCFFLPRKERNSAIFRVTPVSKIKNVHTVKLVHSDQVEAPLTDWLRESFEFSKGS